jgi:hypothetical protein
MNADLYYAQRKKEESADILRDKIVRKIYALGIPAEEFLGCYPRGNDAVENDEWLYAVNRALALLIKKLVDSAYEEEEA